MELNEFSKVFADKLLAKFPELKPYIQITPYTDRDEAYLEVSIPSPHDEDTVLFISTIDEEITVGFDWWHTHIGYAPTEEETYNQAIHLIEEIILEKKAIAYVKKDGNWIYSRLLQPGENVEQKEGERIYVRSWKGTHNND
ncbi:hypothetical protein GTO91_17265 [Heliobacterium undosum]|uniref:Uncharacterized protein n=1 Tax=Heliomicrobium undosum TaxID=121734 RepID=A0A845L9J1_9FIRM|nr:hypothetical protein [Heliomicrobium undosum]MZP31444.1 hypothetical protein [Heliomicrobium undosum]